MFPSEFCHPVDVKYIWKVCSVIRAIGININKDVSDVSV